MAIARRMYGGKDGTPDTLEALGIPSRAAGSFIGAQDLEVWPEHWPVLELFTGLATQWRVGMSGATGLATQWRVGMSGATGLDYTAVLAVLQFSVPKGQQQERFEEIKIMERAALETMSEKNDGR